VTNPRKTVLLISGSLRSGSVNSAVVQTAAAVAPALIDCVAYQGFEDLFHFNPDVEQSNLPESVIHLREQLAQADAVLFCTPEYAGSLPGSFKNLLDWCVGAGLYEKPVGYINASAMGGAQGAHQTLRTVLGYVNATLIENACVSVPVRRDIIDSNGMITDDATRAAIAKTMANLVGLER